MVKVLVVDSKVGMVANNSKVMAAMVLAIKEVEVMEHQIIHKVDKVDIIRVAISNSPVEVSMVIQEEDTHKVDKAMADKVDKDMEDRVEEVAMTRAQITTVVEVVLHMVEEAEVVVVMVETVVVAEVVTVIEEALNLLAIIITGAITSTKMV